MRKIKKLVTTLLAATMVMAMGVTAFAADVKQAAVPKSAAACFN